MTINIRQAHVADADQLAKLRWEHAFYYEDKPGPDERLEDFTVAFRPFIEQILTGGKWAIWVAEEDGILVSQMYVQRIDKVPRPGRFGKQYGYITNVYTLPEYRNNGIGTRLLRRVIAWAGEIELELLIVWPSKASREFYQRQGFAPNLGLFERGIDNEFSTY
ncbi:MAG: GNAT family N-acetyltransferase [Anaerolineae bacterium]|nr:GNAT family N-acetyltransferase [Anaerolineae bacterium]